MWFYSSNTENGNFQEKDTNHNMILETLKENVIRLPIIHPLTSESLKLYGYYQSFK